MYLDSGLMQLHSFTLQVFEVEKTLDFYTEVLGFSLVAERVEEALRYYELALGNKDFCIRLKYDPRVAPIVYQEKASDHYWKYSLFVDDIQKVYQDLRAQQIMIGEPFQFGDIGYLAHTADRENHKIEYIQKTFKQQPAITTTEPTALGLLTIRTKDPVKIIQFYEDLLGMKLFVRMYVERGNGFTLYFLGDKHLQAPNADIDAIENREWMYQQSHLFIEIQHYWNSEYDATFQLHAQENSGLQSINFIGDIALLKQRLIAKGMAFEEQENAIAFKTIDGHTVVVEQG